MRARILTASHSSKRDQHISLREGTSVSEHMAHNSSSSSTSQSKDASVLESSILEDSYARAESVLSELLLNAAQEALFTPHQCQELCRQQQGPCASPQHTGGPWRLFWQSQTVHTGKRGVPTYTGPDMPVPLAGLTSVSGCHLSEAFCCFSFAHTVKTKSYRIGCYFP